MADEIYPDGFDIAALLAPIAGANPAGEDLRQDYSAQSLYLKLRDARAEARAAEREADKGNSEDAAPPREWRMIRDLASSALTGKSKDLEIAAWLTEALVRSDGLRGLAAGATLMAGLAEQYWDGLYPRPDEDGIATLVAPITGLNGSGGEGTLIQPLRKLVLFSRPDGEPVALWNYDQSVEVHGIGDAARKAARLAAGVVPFDAVEAAARAAGAARFAALRQAARAAGAAWQAMTDSVDARAGRDGPQTSQIRDLLRHIMEIADRYAPPEEAGKDAAPAAAETATAATEQPAAAGTARPVATRDDALRSLGELANFFRRTEPHSPLAYTLQEAIRRGRMTWPELLEEIVPDTGSRAAILTSLGIRPPPPEE